MKRLVLLVTVVSGFLSVSAQDIINYFEVASNIAKPVTMKTAQGTYTIRGGERIDGNLGWVEAYDANGNKIVNNTPYKTEIGSNQATIRRYRFQTLYKSTTESNYNNNQYRYKSNNSDFADKLGNYAAMAAGIPQEGYPNLQIRVGASLFMAEYASLKAELGGIGGFVICGGMGKSLFDEMVEGKSWYAGLGYYGGDEDYDISLDFLWVDSHKVLSRALAFELEFSYFFGGGRLGVFADAQMGICFDVASDAEILKFSVGAGVSWKILSE